MSRRNGERLKYRVNEPFGIFCTSWGEEVSSPRFGLSACWRSPPSPSPLSFFNIIFRGVASAFRLRIAIFLGARPLVMDALTEMPETRCKSCLTHHPITRETYPAVSEKNTDSLKFLNLYIFKFLCMKPIVRFFQSV